MQTVTCMIGSYKKMPECIRMGSGKVPLSEVVTLRVVVATSIRLCPCAPKWSVGSSTAVFNHFGEGRDD
jgi:hypothetical protein